MFRIFEKLELFYSCVTELIVCVCSGGRAGYDPRGGASPVKLQVDHLLLRPAAAAAFLQWNREDGQTASHLGANIHVRGGTT